MVDSRGPSRILKKVDFLQYVMQPVPRSVCFWKTGAPEEDGAHTETYKYHQ